MQVESPTADASTPDGPEPAASAPNGAAPAASAPEGADPAKGAATPPPGIPLPPGFPPGVDPATYKLDEVTRGLKRAAYFSLFSIHNTEVQNKVTPLPGEPNSIAALEVFENLHRLLAEVKLPGGCGRFEVDKTLGQQAANIQVHWQPITDDYRASPALVPPLTGLDPSRSQRFTMRDGRFIFRDRNGSGIEGFGAGRTFPAVEGGKPVLRIGAVVDVLKGLGRLAGLQGTAVVNGFISPPSELALNIMIRVMDPDQRLLADGELTPIDPFPDPDADAVFMTFLGEEDTEDPTTLMMSPDGQILGSNVHEKLRLVDVNFDLGESRRGLRARATEGGVVGTLRTSLYFNPLDPATPGTVESPIPYQTRSGEFSFHDYDGNAIGTVKANVVEGRAFKAELVGAPFPVFRFGGFGPIESGTGQFGSASGLLSMNAAISVFPRTLSNLYVFRIYDPDGRFRSRIKEAWG